MPIPSAAIRPWCIALGLLITGALAAQTEAATRTGLMASMKPASAMQVPAYAKPGSGVVGTLNPASLDSTSFDLALPDGTIVTARQTHLQRDPGQQTLVWTGSVAGGPSGGIVLTRSAGVIAGFLEHDGRRYELQPAPGGRYLLFEVDRERLPGADLVRVPGSPAMARAKTGAAVVGRLSASVSPVVQDLLVVYSDAAAGRYGEAGLESMIRSAVAEANASYRASGVGITLNVVELRRLALNDTTGMQQGLTDLQRDSEVAALRDAVGADLAIRVGDFNDGYCGLAYIMSFDATAFAPYAFGVVDAQCLSSNALAHEVGHVQGLAHDRETAGNVGGALPYSYGYRRCTGLFASSFHDIMAYPCPGLFGPGQNRLKTFSSPGIYFESSAGERVATGIAQESDPLRAADAARSLNETAATTAALRASLSTLPGMPGTLTGRAILAGRVELAWSDGGGRVAGIKVERSVAGGPYVEIASLAAGATAYVDETTVRTTTYAYRLAAFNSAGVSPYGNTLILTTPEQIPPAPLAVVATNNRKKTAGLSWGGADDPPVTTYEIRRSMLRKGNWLADVALPSVPGTVLSLVDRSGKGTFKYRVRGCNSGGCSDYAESQPVAVTK